MIDIERAEEFANNGYALGCTKSPFEAAKEGFLTGLKAGRQEKIYNLKKNSKDLPKENQEVLVLFTLPDKSRNDITLAEFENNDFNFVDLQGVIAWCEIPTFKE